MYANRKSFIIKLLIAACLIYLCVHVLSSTNGPLIREVPDPGRSLSALDGSGLDVEIVKDADAKVEIKEAEPVGEPIIEPTKDVVSGEGKQREEGGVVSN